MKFSSLTHWLLNAYRRKQSLMERSQARRRIKAAIAFKRLGGAQ